MFWGLMEAQIIVNQCICARAARAWGWGASYLGLGVLACSTLSNQPSSTPRAIICKPGFIIHELECCVQSCARACPRANAWIPQLWWQCVHVLVPVLMSTHRYLDFGDNVCKLIVDVAELVVPLRLSSIGCLGRRDYHSLVWLALSLLLATDESLGHSSISKLFLEIDQMISIMID